MLTYLDVLEYENQTRVNIFLLMTCDVLSIDYYQ